MGVILVASSPFFHTLLNRNKHPHPLIYMRGVKSEDLVAIVDFLYYGGANVYQESIDAFLAIAEELKLKGLTGNNSQEKTEETFQSPATNISKQVKSKIQHKTENFKPYKNSYEQSLEATEKVETAVAIHNFDICQVNITDKQELDDKVKSMMTKSQNIGRNGRKTDICTVCGKEGMGKDIMDHIEANHLEGVSLPCTYCKKMFRSRAGLRHH